MKIVINTTYGDFGLSTKAMKRLIELGCVAVTVITEDAYTGGKGRGNYERTKDAGDGYEVGIISDVLYKDGNVIRFDDNVRTDPHLIQVVEELGSDASATYAKLGIVEIPDGIDWTIKEYDGLEWVAEAHRTWS